MTATVDAPTWVPFIIGASLLLAAFLVIRAVANTRAADTRRMPAWEDPGPMPDLVPGPYGYRVWQGADGRWRADLIGPDGQPRFDYSLEWGKYDTEDAAHRAARTVSNDHNSLAAAEAARQAATVHRASA